jgi:thiol-disulfide isomerase/thioredoxin
MSSHVDELTPVDPFANESNASPTTEIVIHVSWTYALVGLMLIVGMTGALVAGLWFGRARAAAGTMAQNRLATTGQSTGGSRTGGSRTGGSRTGGSRTAPTPNMAGPQSPAGVTTSIGGTPNVGDPPPDFTLKNLQGEEVRLSALKGRPVLINFWATWCPPCRFEMPAIQKMYDAYQDEGFVVLAVDVEESISSEPVRQAEAVPVEPALSGAEVMAGMYMYHTSVQFTSVGEWWMDVTLEAGGNTARVPPGCRFTIPVKTAL